MAFPEDPLVVTVDLDYGEGWSDVKADVNLREPIKIKRGRSDQGVRTDPGECELQFRNGESKVAPGVVGRYSPRNPSSDLYGRIGRNTPVRVSVHTGEPYLALDGDPANLATTPDHADLDITGDLDLRVEATIDWQATNISQTLIAKWDGASDDRSYILRVINHLLILNWTPDGVSSSFARATLPTLPRRAAIRVTVDADNGVGGFTAAFYWAESMDGPWTLIDEAVNTTSGAQTFHSGAAPLTIGVDDTTVDPARVPPTGEVHRAQVRSGIDGTVVANPDFTAQPVGTTGFTDSAGRVWALTGAAEITNRRVRFLGEISQWPVRWGVTGQQVWASVQGSGILRRLGQGTKAIDSTLRRRIPSDPDLLAYWPMEEDEGATRAYSPIDGVNPMQTSGLTFAADDSLPGSGPLPSLQSTAFLDVAVPQGADTGEWHVEFVYLLETMPTTQTTLINVSTTGTARRLELSVSTDTVRMQGFGSDGVALGSPFNSTAPDFVGDWSRLQIRAVPNGADVDVFVRWVTIGAASLEFTYTYTGSVGRVTALHSSFGTELEGLRLGHFAVFEAAGTTIFDGADTGFAGESTLFRMDRLAAEEGLPLQLYDGDRSANSELVGPQRVATILESVQSVADVDGGILYEARDRVGLVYRDRFSLYNQDVRLALDYTADGEVAPPLEPVDDDEAVRNDVTRKRDGGTSARVVLETGPLSVQDPPAGVGRYDEELTLNLFDDDQPVQHASWRLHLGTWDEARYPTVAVKLHKAPHLIADVLGMDIGDRLQIANPPPWLPQDTIDLLAQGYEEVLHPRKWDLEFNCSPAGPWNVAHVEDPIFGWVDTDGSRLAAAASSTGTLLPVTVTDGPVWVTGSVTYTGATATGAGTSLTPDYLVCADADAADINIGDNVRLFDPEGNLKEFTVFEVISKPSAFGFTNVTVTPDAAEVTEAGDELRVLVATGSAEDFPLPVRVGGEVVTVTGIANDDPASDAFGRSAASGWGTADSGHAWTTTGGSASDFSVSGGAGLHSVGTLNVSRFSVVSASAADFDVQVTVSTPVLAAGNNQQAYLVARYLDTSNYYGARIDFTSAQAVTLTVIKVVAGVPGAFSTVTTSLEHVAGTAFRLRFQGQGSALRAKVWQAGTTEPAVWDTEVADADLTAAGSVGVRTRFLTGNTNPLPVAVSFDDFASPQVMTVERSWNGVVKSQAAGADVRLAYPPITAL